MKGTSSSLCLVVSSNETPLVAPGKVEQEERESERKKFEFGDDHIMFGFTIM